MEKTMTAGEIDRAARSIRDELAAEGRRPSLRDIRAYIRGSLAGDFAEARETRMYRDGSTYCRVAQLWYWMAAA